MKSMAIIRRVALAGLGISFAFSISAIYIFAALLMIIWALERSGEKKILPLDAPIGIYLLWGLLTAVIGQSTSLSSALSYQAVFLLYLLAAHYLDASDLKWVGLWFVSASAVSGLYGFLQYISGATYDHDMRQYRAEGFISSWPQPLIEFFASRNERGVGTRSHPLTFAEGLIPAFFAALFTVFGRILKKERSRDLLGPLLAVLCIASGLIAAEGRAVWAGMGLGILLAACLMPRRWGVIIVGGVFLLGIAASFSPNLRARALSMISASAGRAGDQESKSIRARIWKKSFEQVREHPAAGIGLRGARLQLNDGGVYSERIWTETHNSYLQILLEQGVVGLGLFLWIVVVTFWSLRGAPDPGRWAFLAIWAAFLVAGVTESWVKDREIGMLFWFFVGAAQSWQRKMDLFA